MLSSLFNHPPLVTNPGPWRDLEDPRIVARTARGFTARVASGT